MKNDLQKARELLDTGHYTCVLCKGDCALTDRRRGVRPLLELTGGGRSVHGFSAADKVVGKAAALLYLLMGVSNLYAGVISKPALQTLERGGVTVSYGQLVEAIHNRTGTGFCPMETAVQDVDTPADAPAVLQAALDALTSQ